MFKSNGSPIIFGMISPDPPHHLLPCYAQFLMAGLLLLILAYFSYVIILNDTQTSLNQNTIKQIKGTACTMVLWLIDRDESHKWSTTSGIAAPNTQLLPERLNLDRGSGVCKTPVPVRPSTEREVVQRVTETFSTTMMGPCPLTSPQLQGTTVLLCGGSEACCPSPVQTCPPNLLYVHRIEGISSTFYIMFYNFCAQMNRCFYWAMYKGLQLGF